MRIFLFNTLAVVVGYIAMAISVMVLFSVAYMVIGAEGAFQPQSWDVTTTWIVISIVVSLGAAWLGGKLCRLVARNLVAPKYLIALIVVLGVATGIMAMTGGEVETIRSSAPAVFEAAQSAREPVWITWLNPLLGAVGVAFGSGLLKTRHT